MQKVSIERDLTGTKLAILTPVHHTLTVEFHRSILKAVIELPKYGIELLPVIGHGDSLITRSRNKLVALFMSTGFTHGIFIDSDMGFEPDAILRLLAFDKDVSGVVYQNRHESHNVFAANIENPIVQCPDTGMILAKHIGTGFMMFKREAIEKMFEAYWHLKMWEDDYEENPWLYNLFDTEIRGDRLWGEDFTFCNRWNDLGGKIWVDPVSQLIHVGQRHYSKRLIDCLETKDGKGTNETAEGVS